MRRRGLLAGAVATLASRSSRASTPSAVSAAPAPVMLELFTSQGCSSCPPADAFLGELAAAPGAIALAWHVDYWNSPGWRDPYASATWTARQRLYAGLLGQEVYTPALVVNGVTMVVGSDRSAAYRAMRQAPRLPVAVSLSRTGAGVTASVRDLPEGANLLRVLYWPEVRTGVRGGENAGRQLKEYHIVHDATVLPARTGTIPLGEVPAGSGAVLLVQYPDGRLLGGADLPAA